MSPLKCGAPLVRKQAISLSLNASLLAERVRCFQQGSFLARIFVATFGGNFCMFLDVICAQHEKGGSDVYRHVDADLSVVDIGSG
jgi:hypothetical protein